MSYSTYTYVIGTDFTSLVGTQVDLNALELQVQAAITSPLLSFIVRSSTSVVFYFPSALTGGQQSTLTTVVDAYTYVDTSEYVATTLNSVTLSNKTLNDVIFNGMGNVSAASGTIYVNPNTTALTGSSNVYWTYFSAPTTTGSTTGSTSTLYLAGAPSGGSNNYTLNVAAGKVLFAGSFQYSTGASLGYVLSSDATGNATWVSPSSIESFADGTSALPGIYFTNQPGTGFYRPGSGQIGVELAGANYATFSTTGLSLVNGSILSVGTSGTTSSLSIYGISNHYSTASFTGIGSSTATSATVYIAPTSTTLVGSSNYYFTYLNTPTTSGSTTGTTTTLYVAAAHTGVPTNYSLNVAAGASLFAGNITVSNGNTVSVGTTGTTSVFNIYGTSNHYSTVTLTGVGSATAASATLYSAPVSTAITGASAYYFNYLAAPTTVPTTFTGTATTLYVAGAPTSTTGGTGYALNVGSGASLFGGNMTINNGNTLFVGTSGTTSTLTVYGGISATSTVSFTGLGSTTAAQCTFITNPASTPITGASAYYFNYFAAPTTVPTTFTGTASTLYVAGAPTSTTGGTGYALNVATGASLFGGNLTVSNSNTVSVGTSGTTSILNIYGTSNHYSTVTLTGVGSATAASATLYSAPVSTAITGASTYYFNYLAAPTTVPTSFTGTASTLYVAGAPTSTTGGTGYALNVATGLSLFAGSVNLTAQGSTTASGSTFYVNPTSTALTGSSAYYFNYLAAPTTTASSFTGTASTLYVAGAPTTTTGGTGYALNVATGKVLIAGSLQYSTGAAAGYVLTSDASGNATWGISGSTPYFVITSSAIFSISNTVTTPTNITSITLTPTTAGTYLFRFLSTFYTSSAFGTVQWQFAKNSTTVSGTNFQMTPVLSNSSETVAFEAFITVNGTTDAVTVQVATVSGSQTGVTLPNLKSMTAVRVGS